MSPLVHCSAAGTQGTWGSGTWTASDAEEEDHHGGIALIPLQGLTGARESVRDANKGFPCTPDRCRRRRMRRAARRTLHLLILLQYVILYMNTTVGFLLRSTRVVNMRANGRGATCGYTMVGPAAATAS